MKILLIYPPSGSISAYNTPTGLIYIATVLKKNGYNVQLIDCSVDSAYAEKLESEIRDTDILGVYAMSIHIKYLLPLLERLKKINKRIKIVWGGPHAALFPGQTIESSLADIVVRGEGEEVMLEIVKSCESGKLDLHKIRGISFKEDAKIITTPDRDFINMDELPFLDWSFVKKEVMENIKRSIIRVQTSRGCPYKCAFCINVAVKNKKMRYRSPGKVLDEIEYVCKEYNIRRIGFRDEVFMSNKKQTEEIARGILRRGMRITWLANPRIEYLKEEYVSDEYLKLLAESGCNKLQSGGESGSQRVLDLLRKQCMVEDILNFVRRTKKFGITPVVSFMTGIPTETETEQIQTIRLIRQILRIDKKAFIIGPQNFRPYPGGELYEMCLNKYNLKMPASLEEWAKSDILGGVRPPWVKRMYFNQYLWTSIRAASTYSCKKIWQKIFQNPLKGAGLLFMVILSRLRLKYVFYRFPVEFLLLDWYHRFIIRRIPELS